MFTISCNRDNSSPSSDKPSTNGGERVVELGGETANPVSSPTATPARVPDQVARVVQPSRRETLLSSRNSTAVLPEDFLIGPLTGGEADLSLTTAGGVITSFVAALAAKDLEDAPIAQAKRESLERSLIFYMERNAVPSYARIGMIHADGEDRLRANLRLYGTPGRTEGEVFLVREDRTWVVEDFHSELSKLNDQYVDPYSDEAFEPSKYRWLDLGQGN